MKQFLLIPALLLSILVMTGCSGSKNATSGANNKIQWVTIEQAAQMSKKNPKKVFIDVYTDWCGWCKKMDADTFTHPDIIKYMNENYYAVKFDGEQRSTVKFNGKDYKFVANGRKGYNELSVELLDGRMSYPSVVFLDERLKKIQAIPGYKAPKDMDMILNYFGENHHKKTNWDTFASNYKSTIK